MDVMAFRSDASRVLVWVLIVLNTAGCSSWRPSPLSPISATPAAIRPDPLKLRLVVNQTITLHDWILEGDTLRGSRESSEKGAKVMKPESIALSMIDYREGRTDDEVLPEYLAAKQEELAAARLQAAATPPPMEFPGVTRFRLVNGSTIKLVYAAVDDDSLRGRVPVTVSDPSHRLMILARKDVLHVESKEADTGKTVGLVVLVAAVVLGAFALAMSSVDWSNY